MFCHEIRANFCTDIHGAPKITLMISCFFHLVLQSGKTCLFLFSPSISANYLPTWFYGSCSGNMHRLTRTTSTDFFQWEGAADLPWATWPGTQVWLGLPIVGSCCNAASFRSVDQCLIIPKWIQHRVCWMTCGCSEHSAFTSVVSLCLGLLDSGLCLTDQPQH